MVDVIPVFMSFFPPPFRAPSEWPKSSQETYAEFCFPEHVFWEKGPPALNIVSKEIVTKKAKDLSFKRLL